MPLINVLRQNIQERSAPSYERLVRFLAARAREDADTAKWSARISTGSDGIHVSYVTSVEGYAGLASAEQPEAMIRRLFGEGDGNALVEALGDAVRSSAYLVFNPREDLGSPVIQPAAPAPLAVITQLRTTPGGGPACEELIRKVVEAAAKVDEQRRYVVLQPVVGELGSYSIVQGVTDPAQLDRQASLPELLTKAFGEKNAQAILREGTACIQHAQTELSVQRDDLSNPA